MNRFLRDLRADGHRRGGGPQTARREGSAARPTLVAMANADLIVLAPDRPDVTLVAEVKMRVADLPATERQLKAYMLDRRCPTAVLVTPQRTRIYRDTYFRIP